VRVKPIADFEGVRIMTRIASVLFATFLASVAASFLAFAASHRQDQHAAELGGRQGVALAGGLNIDCNDHGNPGLCSAGVDTTRTAALRVRHRHVGSGRDVEPDIGDTWLVTFTWLSLATANPCACTTTHLTGTVAVDWTGSSWSATCLSGCNGSGGPVWRVRTCGGAECEALASEYILLIDVETILPICAGMTQTFLYAAEFTSIALDDGDVFTRSPCEEILAVAPINTPYTTVDFGAFEYDFDCNFVTTSPIITIEYQ